VGDFHLLFFASFLAHAEKGQERPIGPYGYTSALALIAFTRIADRRVATCHKEKSIKAFHRDTLNCRSSRRNPSALWGEIVHAA